METWYKLSEKTPELNKNVIVRTSKISYFVASLIGIMSSSTGIQYNWNSINGDFEKKFGKVIEWTEIPKSNKL